MPLIVKDNFETTDMPTAAGSLSLKGVMSKADAFQVRKLREDSAYLDSMCWENGLRIVGADYSLSTGAVDVFHQDA